MDSGRHVERSALHYSPGFHRKDLPPVVLANVIDVPARSRSGDAEFVVGTPEVRCRIKILLRWVPAAQNLLVNPGDYHFLVGGVPTSRFGATSLWLAKRDDVDMGGRGCMPVENLAGDIYAGLPIPDRGCMGYICEAETVAQEIWGRLVVDVNGLPGAGRWVLAASADAIEQMTEEEWARVSTRFFARAIRGAELSAAQPG
jgi:hypothetical protein